MHCRRTGTISIQHSSFILSSPIETKILPKIVCSASVGFKSGRHFDFQRISMHLQCARAQRLHLAEPRLLMHGWRIFLGVVFSFAVAVAVLLGAVSVSVVWHAPSLPPSSAYILISPVFQSYISLIFSNILMQELSSLSCYPMPSLSHTIPSTSWDCKYSKNKSSL